MKKRFFFIIILIMSNYSLAQKFESNYFKALNSEVYSVSEINISIKDSSVKIITFNKTQTVENLYKITNIENNIYTIVSDENIVYYIEITEIKGKVKNYIYKFTINMFFQKNSKQGILYYCNKK